MSDIEAITKRDLYEVLILAGMGLGVNVGVSGPAMVQEAIRRAGLLIEAQESRDESHD